MFSVFLSVLGMEAPIGGHLWCLMGSAPFSRHFLNKFLHEIMLTAKIIASYSRVPNSRGGVITGAGRTKFFKKPREGVKYGLNCAS